MKPQAVIDGLQCGRYDREVLENLAENNVSGVTITAAFWEDALETMDTIAHWNDLAREHSDLLLIARTAEDIDIARATQRTAVVLGTQNSSLFNDRLGFIEHFWHMGVRVVQLTYNNQNAIGSSCYEAVDTGLSRFGREVIQEMNRVGMLIDLSHVGERTCVDAIEQSVVPVAINHANARRLYDHPRNKSERVLRALVDHGGVLGVCSYNNIAGPYAANADTIADLITEHAELYGIEHIGLGSDMSPGERVGDIEWMRKGRWTRAEQTGATLPGAPPPPAEWMDDNSKFAEVAKSLLTRGLFTEPEVEQIFYGNFRRLYAQTFEGVEE